MKALKLSCWFVAAFFALACIGGFFISVIAAGEAVFGDAPVWRLLLMPIGFLAMWAGISIAMAVLHWSVEP